MKAFLVCVLIFGVCGENLLSSTDLDEIAKAVNSARDEVKSNLPSLTLDQNLTSLAEGWVSQCTFRNDRKLKFLYSSAYLSSNVTYNGTQLALMWLTEGAFVNQKVSHELVAAQNWTALMWENSTEIGCAASRCGNLMMFGCLLSPKGGFPGIMPFKDLCAPNITIDCEAYGRCGQYFDGCKRVVCGPTCNTTTFFNSTERRSIEDPRTRGLFASDSTKRQYVNGIYTNQAIWGGGYLYSADYRFILVMQGDGNLVAYSSTAAFWSSGTSNSLPGGASYMLSLQGDGNMVLYGFYGGGTYPLWWTGTGGGAPIALYMQTDGNIVLYNNFGVIWSSGTNGGYWEQKLWDWRDTGIVSGIKNQGQCGACYAFSGSEIIESQYARYHGWLPSVSPQQLMDCSPDSAHPSGSCNGGYVQTVLQWTPGHPLASEGQYPYRSYQQGCQGYPSSSVSGSNSQPFINFGAGPDALLFGLQNYGPIVIWFRVEDPFYGYAGGIYGTGCATTGVNHNMVIVGLGQNSYGQQWWIVRNQWGTGWGEGGYVRILRGANICEIESYSAGFMPN